MTTDAAVNLVTALIDLGLKVAERRRAARVAEGEDLKPLAAEEVRAMIVEDWDDLVERGRQQARSEGD